MDGMKTRQILSLAMVVAMAPTVLSNAQARPKTHPAFFPPERVAQARKNAAVLPWAGKVRDRILSTAEPWLKLSDRELWDLMFGPTIKRAWQVWSNGFCPSCKASVPMYSWQMAALERPWKTRCPHCKELFPKNDFGKFYRSGLDSRGVFDPAKADRSLLFNSEHPDPNDPLHRFGVDDGEGYVDGPNRWRFIGAYLIFGQWKQAIVGGIRALADAYVVTGDRRYGRRALVLLDRVADLYPEHDFGKQGVMYEGAPRAGYVSTWHDACEETRWLAIAYDQVFPAAEGDAELCAFLSRMAAQHGLTNPKRTASDVRRNIEEGILKHALANRDRIYSNYPRTEVTAATIMAVLDWPANRAEVLAMLDPVIAKSTAVDGNTGEKGLSGYTAYAVGGVAEILSWFDRLDDGLLPELVRKHPRIKDCFRFHIDTWCGNGNYYPAIGDTGGFAARVSRYIGVPFVEDYGLAPSMHRFFWRLYETTGDADFVRISYRSNGSKTEGLPYDLLDRDPSAAQARVAEVIRQKGEAIDTPSVDKKEWRLAILRDRPKSPSRELWLDYDSGGQHGHADGLNLGLYAEGLDLLPDFGYPPVQFGGWGAPRSVWYTMTASHNTVVVDGKNHRPGGGRTTLWAPGKTLQAMRAAAPDLIGGGRFERTAAMAPTVDGDFYVLDLFRVTGGQDHARFITGTYGKLRTTGLSLNHAPDYGFGTQMRSFRMDPDTKRGWSAEWEIEDRYSYLPKGKIVGFRYFDLTSGASAGVCETWIDPAGYAKPDGEWIPRLVIRRKGADGLASTFAGIFEVHGGTSRIRDVRRLVATDEKGNHLPDTILVIEMRLTNGEREILVANDPEKPVIVHIPSLNVVFDGDLCRFRLDAKGEATSASLCHSRKIVSGRRAFTSDPKSPISEKPATR